MPAAISPTGLGATSYAITGSRRIQVDLQLDFFLGSFYTFTLTYPTATPGVQVTLIRGATTLNLLPGPINDAVTFGVFPSRVITASTSPAGSDTVLTCTLATNAGEVMDEAWIVRIVASATANWTFEQLDNTLGNLTVTRLMCDPLAQISSVVPAASKEKDPVLLTASPANPVGTVVGPAPAIYYRWTYTGTIVVDDFPATGLSQTHAFDAPGVYGTANITLGLQTWLEGDAVTPGFLTSSITQPLTISPRTQHLMLVLDRSGSMAGDRWNNAVVAARMMAQMYMALRANVATADRIGILVFDDNSCSWRSFYGPSANIQLAMTLTAVGSGAGIPGMCTVNLGSPGGCTPIGDALIEAMKHLQPLHSVTDVPKYHVVLLTDGYENAGSIFLKSTPSATGAGAASFASKRGATVSGVPLAPVNNNMFLYPIGLGATVDDQVLNELSFANTGLPTIYRNITSPSQLKSAFAQMVGYSQEAQELLFASSPAALEAALLGAVDVPDDPGAPAAQYVAVDPFANRLILAVQWGAGVNTIEIAKAGAGGPYTPLAVTPAICTSHGFVSIDIASLYGGESNVPQTFWRVVHKLGGVPQAIPAANFFAYVDLRVKMDIVFDKREYRTGDRMRITARLREAHRTIRGARVYVELARPGQSLGSFLAINADYYKPRTDQSRDQPPPKEDMLQQLLRAKGLDSLTIPSPGIFSDGTSDLVDDGMHYDGSANDGNYANTYDQVNHEGVYTFRIVAVGRLKNGAFSRVLTVSTWCGIRPDIGSSPVTVTWGIQAPDGYEGLRATVRPMNEKREFLGPFRQDELEFVATTGSWQGTITSEFNGVYHQVLYFRKGEKPEVKVRFKYEKSGLKPSATATLSPAGDATQGSDCQEALCRLLQMLTKAVCGDKT